MAKLIVGVNDLATVKPELAKEVSPNSKIKATEITFSSNKKLLWRCSKGHEWKGTVNHRCQGCGCPYCSNKKILAGFNDLATTNPDLAKQVSPNSEIRATEVTTNSGKQMLWMCSNGHEWEARVYSRSKGNGCPYCSGGRATVGVNDLATVKPELAKEVSPNSEIKAMEVTIGSGKRLLWICGIGHEWEASVAVRSKGRGCPYCSNRKVLLGFNDLTTTNPELAKEVSPDSKIKASEVTVSSGKKLLWICNNGHEWEATVANRSNGNGCPFCSNNKVLPGFNDLSTTSPELAKRVSPNSKIRAIEVTTCSNKKLLWVCSRGHEWEATVYDRSQGRGCPYCSNKRILIGFNDLGTTNPELAKEVSPNSEIKATEVTAGSDKKLLWRCRKGHEWESTVNDRSQGKGCPYCSGRNAIVGVNDLAHTSPELAKEVSPNSKIKSTKITAGSKKQLLWICSMGHEWGATVYDRSQGNGCPYCSNHRVLPGFNDLGSTNPELAKEVSPNSEIKATEVTAGSDKKLLWRCRKGHEWESKIYSRSNGIGCPYCSNQKVLIGFNDLATTNPRLSKEVSPNSKIKSTEVVAGSEKKLLWVCSEGHEWEAAVLHRSQNTGCPKCSGSKMEENLAGLVRTLLPSNTEIIRNDRQLIRPYELDILIPKLNLAFEFNGDYWHSNEMIRKRHPQFTSSKEFDDFKKQECEKRDVKLFFVKEKQWVNNYEKTVDRIKRIVGGVLRNCLRCI